MNKPICQIPGKRGAGAVGGKRAARLSSLAVLVLPMLLSGCTSGALTALVGPGMPAEDLKVVARLQQPEPGPVAPPPANSLPPAGPSGQALAGPPASSLSGPPASALTGPPASALTGPPGSLQPPGPASLENSIKVRAWVNGSPLFEEEFIMNYSPDLRFRLSALAPGDPKGKDIMKEERDRLIDKELMFQDACNKLSKANEKVLDKLKKEAYKEYEKQMQVIRDNIRKREPNISAARMREHEAELRHMRRLLVRRAERDFISGEYMKFRLVSKVQQVVDPKAVKDEYDNHLNMYIKPETVKWQDVFILVDGKKHATLADARRFADRLVDTYRHDFAKVLDYNDGDSKARGGEGYGTHPAYKLGNTEIPTDIKPAELEPHLLRMRDGDIKVVDMVSGVHVIRMIKHEPGGQRPFNAEVQLEIRNKLRNEVFLRELKYLVRELRYRADIVVVPD